MPIAKPFLIVPHVDFAIRHATTADIPALNQLIALSARELGRHYYTEDQIEAALGTAWGVDSQLINDCTFFVVLHNIELVACGGWSKRKALFGADSRAGLEPDLLDPTHEAARIRAFFVHPAWARHGIGKFLLAHCEAEARAAGFHSGELVATLPGQRLYETCGYLPKAKIEHPLKPGLMITFIPMKKPKL